MKRKGRVGFLCLLCIAMLSGCSFLEKEKGETLQLEEAQEATQREIFAMDTYMTVTAYGGEKAEKAADEAIKEIERLEALLSVSQEGSETALLNQKGEGTVSEDTAVLFTYAKNLCQDTAGAFDISVYPLMEAWGFPSGNFKVPGQKEIKEILSKVNGTKIELSKDKQVRFGISGMKIDFGGIAKGYTSSRIIEIWKEQGISSGMVNLGGNVQVLGTKNDGSLWKVGIQSPEEAKEYLGVLEVQDCAVITSGGYERYFEEEGVTYHHILDPKTGYPAESDLTSVTIVSEDGTLADGLSTALFVMGKEEALQFWQSHREEFDAILLEENGTVSVTAGISEHFTSEYPIEVVK